MSLRAKYFKPKSLTWWSGFIPIAAGLIVASEPLHGWADLVATIDNVTGGTRPIVMINLGLGLIGVRGMNG